MKEFTGKSFENEKKILFHWTAMWSKKRNIEYVSAFIILQRKIIKIIILFSIRVFQKL